MHFIESLNQIVIPHQKSIRVILKVSIKIYKIKILFFMKYLFKTNLYLPIYLTKLSRFNFNQIFKIIQKIILTVTLFISTTYRIISQLCD